MREKKEPIFNKKKKGGKKEKIQFKISHRKDTIQLP